MHSKIDTIARRKKLPVSSKPVWDTIGDARSGLKLGYYKGARGGVWIGKLIMDGARIEAKLGATDDGSGKGLSYIDALTAAAAWAEKEKARLVESANEKADRVITVADAIETYVKMRIARAERAGRDAQTRLARHVLRDVKLSSLPVGRVTARALNDWRSRLPATLAAAGTNRLLNDFRAALNAHVAAHWRDLPATLGKEIETGLKALPNAQTARQALLSDSDVRKIVDAAYGVDPDLGALVLIARQHRRTVLAGREDHGRGPSARSGPRDGSGVEEGQGRQAAAQFGCPAGAGHGRTAQALEQRARRA